MLAALSGPFVVLVPPADAHMVVAVSTTFPSTAQVGATGVPASFLIQNVSTPPESATPFIIEPVVDGGPDAITLVPSCGGPMETDRSGLEDTHHGTAGDCPTPDAGVFALSASGLGAVGTGCAGTTFGITVVDATGKVAFSPSTPVVLQPPGSGSDTCRITFTFSVLRKPTIDSQPDVPGFQTTQLSYASGRHPATGGTFITAGTSIPVTFPPVPLFVTQVATPMVMLGRPISDTATLTWDSGGPVPAGTVTFTLYGSGNPTCAGAPIFTSGPRPLSPGGPGPPPTATATSDTFLPPEPGQYHWIALYSGDANYASGVSGCRSDNATSLVLHPAAPTITTVASPTVTIGSPISDTATVTGLFSYPRPTGTVTFTSFGPSNPTCTGVPIFDSGPRPLTPAAGGPPYPATAASNPFVPSALGQYKWVAVYSGDANWPPVTGFCGDANETSVVNLADPTITTQALGPVVLGSPVRDTATVTGAFSAPIPTGTVTFTLFGVGDVTCSGTPIFTSPARPLGGGTPRTATSADFIAPSPGAYRWMARYNGDDNNRAVTHPCGSPNETSVVVSPAVGGRFRPLTPARILDTRSASPVGPGATVDVQITGLGGVPATGVSAVAVNVTVTQPTGSGFMTIYPAGTARPLTANLNFTPAKTVPNLVLVKLGTGGKVSMYNSAGSTHAVYDVAGWYAEASSGDDGRYIPLTPTRILDTRNGTGDGVRLNPGTSLDVQVSGMGGAPATGVAAAVINLAATATTASSFLTVYPTGQARPLAANLSFTAGETVANRAMVKLGSGGKVTIYNHAGSTDVIVDVGGWFTDPSVMGATGYTTALTPARILDTRNGTGGVTGPRGAGSTVDVQVTGRGGVPDSGVSAVIFNATVVSTNGGGFLTIFPSGTSRPLASDLNYAAGEIRPNLVVAKVGAGGKVSMFTSAGTHVVYDVAGWIS